jgi:hypothetical protein
MDNFTFIMDFKRMGCGDMDRIDLAQDRLQWRALGNKVVNHRVPQNVGKLLIGRANGGFSRRAQLHGVIIMYNYYLSLLILVPLVNLMLPYLLFNICSLCIFSPECTSSI